MHKPDRSRNAAFAQTWPAAGAEIRSALGQVSTVSTLRVRLIGSEENACPINGSAHNDGDPWRDVSRLNDSGDRSYQAMAFARTLPAVPLDDLGVEESGVREIRRLQLWLHPRDSAEVTQSCERRDVTATLRVTRSTIHPLGRLWEAWEHQSPGMAIFTAAVLCVVSALAVSLFAN